MAPHEYPWVRWRTCQQCRTWQCFTFQRAWQDKDGTRWASYKDTHGHQDYGTVTRQVYAQLNGGEDGGKGR